MSQIWVAGGLLEVMKRLHIADPGIDVGLVEAMDWIGLVGLDWIGLI